MKPPTRLLRHRWVVISNPGDLGELRFHKRAKDRYVITGAGSVWTSPGRISGFTTHKYGTGSGSDRVQVTI